MLVVSFVGLAVLWPRPRLESAPRAPRLVGLPVAREIVFGALGVAAFAVSVYAGFAGVHSATANLLPTVVYVVFWVAIPFASLLFGEVFAPINPWRAVARAAAWAFGRARGETPAPLAYPAWLGQWPAALGILAFAWLELVYSNKDDPTAARGARPRLRGGAARRHEPVRHHRVGAQRRRVRRLLRLLRAPVAAALAPRAAEPAPGRWRASRRSSRRRAPSALLCVAIGTTSFDGMSQGAIWTGQEGIAPGLQQRFVNLGFTGETALEITFTIGLLAMVALVSGVFRLGVARDARRSTARIRRRSSRACSRRRWCRSPSPTSSRTTSRCSSTRGRRWPT